jgi:superfamily II DNA or RNA helicase
MTDRISGVKSSIRAAIDSGDTETVLPLITEWRVASSMPLDGDNPKAKVARIILNDIAFGRVLLVTAFEQTAARIGEIFNAKVISGKVPLKRRDKIIDEFATNSDRMLIGVNQACREGLNLPFVKTIVFWDGSWTDAAQTQIRDRIRRITSTHRFIYEITLKSSDDPEDWMRSIRARKAIENRALKEGRNLSDLGYADALAGSHIGVFV